MATAKKKTVKKTPAEKLGGFLCCKCGKIYPERERNFPRVSNALMYAGNDRYLPICQDCFVKLYDDMAYEYGSESQAAKQLCQMFFLYWNPKAFGAAYSQTKSKIMAYLSKVNMSQYNKGTTWFDTMRQEAENNAEIAAAEAALMEAEAPSDGMIAVSSAQQILKWGTSFTPEEHKHLDEHYGLLASLAEDPSAQDPILKTLCETDVMKARAIKDGQIDNFKKLSDLYKSYYKEIVFKKAEAEDIREIELQPLGIMAAIVEGITPAEYYKEQKLFKDYDGIGDYVDRFVIRPLRNLLTGSKDRDKECVVRDET